MFQKIIFKHYSLNEKNISHSWIELQEYRKKEGYIKTVKEEKFQEGFLRAIFEKVLGYTLDTTNPKDFNLSREEKNETDAKKADSVILLDGKVVGVIELKPYRVQNLDQVENQAFNYHNSNSKNRYIIISNFDEVRFYIDKKTSFEKFSLFDMDYTEFKKFYLLLSWNSIKNGIPLQLKEKSADFEEQIKSKFYKDYSSFRMCIFENLMKNNAQIDKNILLKLTQKLCDRIIFILFAEDRGLLNPNTIKEIREEFKTQKFTSFGLYDIYKFYFEAINSGDKKLNIPKSYKRYTDNVNYLLNMPKKDRYDKTTKYAIAYFKGKEIYTTEFLMAKQLGFIKKFQGHSELKEYLKIIPFVFGLGLFDEFFKNIQNKRVISSLMYNRQDRIFHILDEDNYLVTFYINSKKNFEKQLGKKFNKADRWEGGYFSILSPAEPFWRHLSTLLNSDKEVPDSSIPNPTGVAFWRHLNLIELLYQYLKQKSISQNDFISLVDTIMLNKEKIKKYKKYMDKLNAVEKGEILEEIDSLEKEIKIA